MDSQPTVLISEGPWWRPYLYELKDIFTLAWPTSLSILFHYLIQPISLMFCGHLGKTQLASAAMAISVIYITCVSIGRGLAFGCDTFFSQTYGSRNKKKMGVYLQTGAIFGVLCSFPVCALLLNTESILLLLRQQPEVARLAHEYTLMFLPGVLAYNWLFMLMRYLLCQNNVLPNLYINIASCGFNALLHYGLVIQAGMGIKGSAIAMALTYYFVLILLVAYIWGSGMYRETWPGWTWESLVDWWPFARVCVSSIVMTVIFWLCTEIGTFLAGLLGEEEISAFSICFQVEGFAWMIPLGVGGACTARIGQYLGANEPQGAIRTCRTALSVQIIVSVILGGTCYIFRYYIPAAFTTNQELINYTAQIMQQVAIFVLLEGIGGVGVSIVRGTGRQTLGAVIIFVAYYVIALPVGVPLMFLTKLGQAGLWWGYILVIMTACIAGVCLLLGLWWGYILGIATQNVCLLIFLAWMNWNKEADDAQLRAGVVEDVTPFRHVQDNQTSEQDEEHQEPNERTNLIRNESSQSLSNRNINWPRIYVMRLSLLIGSILILVGGIFLSLYYKVPIKWTELCIPRNHSSNSISMVMDSVANSEYSISLSNHTLPWCDNITMLHGQWDENLPHWATPYTRVIV